ncbi:MAG TPA: LysM peptidoglycan-binding domain-containing protein [Bacillota bacterium]|nr:LysM peptidoglycan-binding domain-containing protein [Bacillota bacterium]
MFVYVDKYTVKPGDTLRGISRSFGLQSYQQLLHINPEISNPNLIYTGQVINIPKAVPMSTYVVKPGDTLGTIIANYNRELLEIYGFEITFNEVLAYNPGITNPELIFPGMVIYLPEIL